MRSTNGRFILVPLEERFMKSFTQTEKGCWVWNKTKNYAGYGLLISKGKKIRAHRFGYELFRGRIPDGLQIDHLCRNTSCVNPEHLELVTNRENSLRGFNPCAQNARKTHCKNGHQDFVPRYLKSKKIGRRCMECNRIANQKYRKKQNSVAVEAA